MYAFLHVCYIQIKRAKKILFQGLSDLLQYPEYPKREIVGHNLKGITYLHSFLPVIKSVLRCQLFFFKKKKNLREDNYFTILWWVLPYISMSQPQVYMFPPSWILLPCPSSPHPFGLSHSTGFGCPASCIELTKMVLMILQGSKGDTDISFSVNPSSPPSSPLALFVVMS